LDAFGSYWLFINQIKFAPFLTGVKCFKPNCLTTISISESIELKETPANVFSGSNISYKEELKRLINPISDLKPNVSLSGGLDSRLIFALIEGQKNSHSFGYEFNKDMEVAAKISSSMNSTHKEYYFDDFIINEYIDSINDFVGITSGTMLFTGIDKIEVLQNINNSNFFMIDGGFGELHRRQFLTKVALVKRRKADVVFSTLFDSLVDSKPNFFNPEFYGLLQKNQFEAVHEIWENSLTTSQNNIEEACDYFSYETRVKNITRYSQAWYDNYLISYMPFLQPSIINILFKLPLPEKRNSSLIRSIIEETPALHKIELTKDEIVYPFNTPILLFKIYRLLHKKFTKYNDHREPGFLKRNKTFILDTFYSSDTKNSPYYDYSNLEKNIRSLHENHDANSKLIIYWLNFHFLIKSLKI
jgi:hypothetical protein